MHVLGIESSCDETAAAVVTEEGVVESDVVASQIRVHAPYGGVVPELASRAHLTAIVPVLRAALDPLPGGLRDVDAVAVTQGPGLVGALLVGLQVARSIAWCTGKPIVGVSHLDGHLLAVQLRRAGGPPPPAYPYIALLASGGHTALYEVRGPLTIALLGQTRDDAAGEAFDKVAKLLALGYPGGPIVDRLASVGDAHAVALPVPMLGHGLDFSFSGIKTAVANLVRARGMPATERDRADLCASFQRVVVESLVQKAVRACEERHVSTLALAGGVAANQGLRARATEACAAGGISLHVPPLASCTDNAAMIAFAGAQRLRGTAGHALEPTQVFSRDPGYRRGRM